MLVIIDTNRFSDIANGHVELKPLIDYINTGNGIFVYGGKTYARELSKHGPFLGLLKEWRNTHKAKKLDDKSVDNNEAFLYKTFKRKGFDDHHILAMAIYSGTDIVCTEDPGLLVLIKSCYSNNGRMKVEKNCIHTCRLKKPKIYRGLKHIGLLI